MGASALLLLVLAGHALAVWLAVGARSSPPSAAS